MPDNYVYSIGIEGRETVTSAVRRAERALSALQNRLHKVTATYSKLQASLTTSLLPPEFSRYATTIGEFSTSSSRLVDIQSSLNKNIELASTGLNKLTTGYLRNQKVINDVSSAVSKLNLASGEYSKGFTNALGVTKQFDKQLTLFNTGLLSQTNAYKIGQTAVDKWTTAHNAALKATKNLKQGTLTVSKSLGAYNAEIGKLTPLLSQATRINRNLDEQIIKTARGFKESDVALKSYKTSIDRSQISLDKWTSIVTKQTRAQQQTIRSLQLNDKAYTKLASVLPRYGTAIDKLSGASLNLQRVQSSVSKSIGQTTSTLKPLISGYTQNYKLVDEINSAYSEAGTAFGKFNKNIISSTNTFGQFNKQLALSNQKLSSQVEAYKGGQATLEKWVESSIAGREANKLLQQSVIASTKTVQDHNTAVSKSSAALTQASKQIVDTTRHYKENSTALTEATTSSAKAIEQHDTTVGKWTASLAKSSKVTSSLQKKLSDSLSIYHKSDATLKSFATSLDSSRTAASDWMSTLTKQASVQQYVNLLLKSSGEEYAKLANYISETGIAQQIANEIAEKGYKALTPELRKQLEARVKEIETIQKSGVAVDRYTKAQMRDILNLNDALKRHHTFWGRVRKGIEGTFSTIKEVGIAFLTILGPLFLVDAALRAVNQALQWVFQPFIEFEDKLFELRKTTDMTVKSMLEMGDAITQMTQYIPMAATDLAEIAVNAGRLGIRGKADILAFTETIAKLSIATTLTAEQAAEDLAKIREAFGVPIDRIENLASVMNELENTTAITVEELVAGMKNIGAAGRMLGITADEASALAATLIAAGMSGERAGTRLRRMFVELAQKVDEITEFMGDAGEEWRKALEEDPMQALLMYLEKLREVPCAVKRIQIAHKHFGEVGGFAISTLAKNYDSLIKNLKTAEDEMLYGTSLQEEFAIATGKTSAQLQLLDNRMEAARREMGEALEPALIATKGLLASATEAAAGFIKGLIGVGDSAKYASDALNTIVESAKEDVKTMEGNVSVWGVLGRTLRVVAMGAFGWREQLAAMHKEEEQLGDESLSLGHKISFLLPPFGALKTALTETREEMEKSGERARATAQYFEKLDLLASDLDVGYAKIGKSLAEYNAKSEDTLEIEKQIVNWEKTRVHILTGIEKAVKENTLTDREATAERLKMQAVEAALREEWRASMKKDIELRMKQGKATEDDIKNYHRLIAVEQADKDVLNELNDVRAMGRVILDETSPIHQQLIALLGEEAMKNWTLEDAYANLTKAGYDLITMGGKLYVTDKSLLDIQGKIADPIKLLTELRKEYGEETIKAAQANEQLQIKSRDLLIAYEELEYWEKKRLDTLHEMIDSSYDLVDASDNVVNSLFSMYSSYDRILDIEAEADDVTLQMINNWRDEIDAIDKLINISESLLDVQDESIRLEKQRSAETIIAAQAENLLNQAKAAGLDLDTGIWKKINDIVESSKDLNEMDAESAMILAKKAASLFNIATAQLIYAKYAKVSTDEERERVKKIMDYYSSWSRMWGPQLSGIKSSTDAFNKQWDTVNELVSTYKSISDAITNEYSPGVEQALKDVQALKDIWGLTGDAIRNAINSVQLLSKQIELIPSEKQITATLNTDTFFEDWQKLKEQVEKETWTVHVTTDANLTSLFGTGKGTAMINLETEEIPSFQYGGVVEKTGIYRLHKGEEVIPTKTSKSQNINVTVNFPNMIIREELDINKVRHKIVEVINTELSRKLLR